MMRYYYQMYIGTDKYTYKLTHHDSADSSDLEYLRAKLVPIKDHLVNKRILCYSYIIYSSDDTVGTIEVVETGGERSPLKERLEINKEAKEKKVKPKPAGEVGFVWPAGLGAPVMTGIGDVVMAQAAVRPRVAQPRVMTDRERRDALNMQTAQMR